VREGRLPRQRQTSPGRRDHLWTWRSGLRDLESEWPYQDVQEVKLAAVSNIALSAVVIPAEVLLIYSFAYAAWRAQHRTPASGEDARAVSNRAPPDRIRRRCGFAALGASRRSAFWAARWPRPALTAAPCSTSDCTGHRSPWRRSRVRSLSAPRVWLLGLAQRHLNRPPGPRGRALARSAYGAFLLQGIVLIGFMIALRPVHVPAEIKALAVAGFGVAGSFGLAWLLVTRTPLGRIL
jgi:hypothetical protein